MPKLNTRGEVIMGAGGVPGSLNGTYYPFQTYGRGAFIDDNRLVVAPVASGALLGTWDIGAPGPVVIEPPRIANGIAGGGGQWIALGTAPDGESLLYGSIPDLRGAGMGSVASDGTIAFKSLYYSYDGITIIPPGASRPASVDWPHVPPDWISVPQAINPANLQALPGGRAIWLGGAYGRAVPRPYFADPLGLKLVETSDGQAWLCYWQNGVGLVLQVDGESAGYLLEARGVAYDHDIIADGADVIVASSWTASEAPQDLVLLRANRSGLVYLRDVDAARVLPVWQSFAQPVPPDPVPPDPVPPDPPDPEPEPAPEPEPQPPDPTPIPEPQPPDVGGPMLHAYASPMSGFMPGTTVENADGTVSVKKPNGKYLCVTPDGKLEERDTPGGVWESFKVGRGCLIAERDGEARGLLVYVLPAAESEQ